MGGRSLIYFGNPMIEKWSYAILILSVLVAPSILMAGDISVAVELESRDVYVGESFILQISIDGSDKVEPPEIPEIDAFNVEYVGGTNNSSQSITIINGKLERTVHRGFVFSYRLTPKKPGKYTIPSIKVEVEGKVYSTDPVTVMVRRPGESEDFKLRLTLSSDHCYVGEPVVLTVTWYIGRDVRDFQFTIPIFDMRDVFDFETPNIKIDTRNNYYRVPVGNEEVIAKKGSGILDGVRYATLEFKKVLIPKRAGTFTLPEAVVACKAIVRVRSRRDFFDDFFNDDFFGMSRGKLRKYVVASNQPTLVVKALPQEGRPDGFMGHVGRYKISATAEPTEVNVGDPITLNIIVEGPDYLGNVDFPPLAMQEELARNFKIPSERAEGKVEGKKKIFTQTIRAKNDKVKEIPPIKLVYFDTGEGRYKVASTEPIPIVVHPTKVITAEDAEGGPPGGYSSPVEKWKEGIAYNYEGPELLVPDYYGISSVVFRPIFIAVLVIPPFIFFVILATVSILKRREATTGVRKAKSALRRFGRDVDRLLKDGLDDRTFGEKLLVLLRGYFATRLQRSSSALTAQDLRLELEARGVECSKFDRLFDIMEKLEAMAYAGDTSFLSNRDELAGELKELIREIDRAIG